MILWLRRPILWGLRQPHASRAVCLGCWEAPKAATRIRVEPPDTSEVLADAAACGKQNPNRAEDTLLVVRFVSWQLCLASSTQTHLQGG